MILLHQVGSYTLARKSSKFEDQGMMFVGFDVDSDVPFEVNKEQTGTI